jgi:hypothetical protein
MQKIIFAIGAGVVLSTTYTMAQQGQIREECAADIRAACGDVAPGGIRSCLNSHLADLSRPCQAVLVRTFEKRYVGSGSANTSYVLLASSWICFCCSGEWVL